MDFVADGECDSASWSAVTLAADGGHAEMVRFFSESTGEL